MKIYWDDFQFGRRLNRRGTQVKPLFNLCVALNSSKRFIWKGSLNLATRDLPCLPTALFEIHLGLTPDPLKSVPNEPILPPSELKPSRRGASKPSWFEAQDLTVLKAWNNDIQEVQHEISLFGSLKTVDVSIFYYIYVIRFTYI